MIYNDDAPRVVEPSLNTSIYTYRNTPSVREQIDMGLMYRIKIRNSRGQLMADELYQSKLVLRLNSHSNALIRSLNECG